MTRSSFPDAQRIKLDLSKLFNKIWDDVAVDWLVLKKSLHILGSVAVVDFLNRLGVLLRHFLEQIVESWNVSTTVEWLDQQPN